jgi:hypothetical protein
MLVHGYINDHLSQEQKDAYVFSLYKHNIINYTNEEQNNGIRKMIYDVLKNTYPDQTPKDTETETVSTYTPDTVSAPCEDIIDDDHAQDI